MSAELLTNQLALSIQFQAMKNALQQNLVLMRKEYESLKPSRTCSAPISRIMLAEAEKWRLAIEASEKALKPVEIPVSLPESTRCAGCGQETPGTIDGLCLACDEVRASVQSITPCNCPSCAGTVLEREHRETQRVLLQMARRPQ